MKILIDIGHPAHVHYFKNFYKQMISRGHTILVTARDKEITHELLEQYNIPFVNRGTGSNSLVGKAFYLPKANWYLMKGAIRFKPDIFLSFSSPYAAQVSSLFRKPHIALDDTEHATFARKIYMPFTDKVLSPSSFKLDLGSKQVKFDSFLELLYLHPDIFSPNQDVLDLLDVNRQEKFVICRFVSWNANHDVGHKGISIQNKRRVVEEFSKYAKVFITSEAPLPKGLEKYRINIPAHKIHDALYYSSLLYGESATMASEAAMLGTPSVFLDNDGRGYTNELEDKFGLVSNFTESDSDQKQSIKRGVELLKIPRYVWREKRTKIINEKINLTEFLISFVESYF